MNTTPNKLFNITGGTTMIKNEENAFDMPENTREEIIDKISALAWQIRCDWSDPRSECRKIVALCDKLKTL